MFLLYRAVTWPRVVCPRMRARFSPGHAAAIAVSTEVHTEKLTTQAQ